MRSLLVMLVACACAAKHDAPTAVKPSSAIASPDAAPKPPRFGVDLATAADRLNPLETSHLVVTVTRRAILVDDEPVASVRSGDVDAAEKVQGRDGIAISQVARRLPELLKRDRASAAKHHAPAPDDAITFVIDPATPYRLVFAVLNSATEAQLGPFHLVLQGAHDLGQITTAPAPATADEHARPPTRLVLAIRAKDVRLLASNDADHPLVTVPRAADGSFDTAPLTAAGVTAAKARQDTRPLVVVADPDVAYQAVIDAVVALRTIFPDFVLASGF